MAYTPESRRFITCRDTQSSGPDFEAVVSFLPAYAHPSKIVINGLCFNVADLRALIADYDTNHRGVPDEPVDWVPDEPGGRSWPPLPAGTTPS